MREPLTVWPFYLGAERGRYYVFPSFLYTCLQYHVQYWYIIGISPSQQKEEYLLVHSQEWVPKAPRPWGGDIQGLNLSVVLWTCQPSRIGHLQRDIASCM